jgi:hypothetical protein
MANINADDHAVVLHAPAEYDFVDADGSIILRTPADYARAGMRLCETAQHLIYEGELQTTAWQLLEAAASHTDTRIASAATEIAAIAGHALDARVNATANE